MYLNPASVVGSGSKKDSNNNMGLTKIQMIQHS